MKRICTFFLALVSSLSLYAQTISIEVNAPKTATINELVCVKFVITSAESKSEQLNIQEFVAPILDGAEIITRPSRSSASSVSIVDGKFHKSISATYSYMIKYAKAGEYLIDSVRVLIDDIEYISQSQKITITNNKQGGKTERKQSTAQKQENKPKQPHNNFRNIELDGHLEAFCDEMVALGYTRSLFYSKQSHAATAEFNGRYGGEPSTLYVHTTPTSNTVYAVRVIVECYSWQILENKYLKFKKLFEEKYGSPMKVVEKFSTPYKKGDGRECEALQKGLCTYSSAFNSTPAGLGSIQLMIVGSEGKYYVVIDFVDQLNGNLYEKEIKESI